MIAQYKVYRKISKNENQVCVSYAEIPEYMMKTKKKFVGKRAKIEAIYRLSGERLPDDYTTEQVNDYLSVNLFNTSKWRAYRKTLAEVQSEDDVFTEHYKFEYNLIVKFKENVNPADGRIIYLIAAELYGTPCKFYKGMRNTILSLEKKFD